MQQQQLWAAAAPCVLSQPLTFNRSGLLVTGPHTVASETRRQEGWSEIFDGQGILDPCERGPLTNIGMSILP